MQEPILCRLVIVVSAQCPVSVNERGLVWEVIDQIVLRRIRIFYDCSYPPYVKDRKHFQNQLVEVLSIPRPLQDIVGLFLCVKVNQIVMLSSEV